MRNFLLFILILIHQGVNAQTLVLDTKEKYFNGDSRVMQDQVTFSIGLALLSSKLSVKAAGNLINESLGSIPISAIKMKLEGIKNNGVVVNLGGVNTEVILSTEPLEFYSGIKIELNASYALTLKYSYQDGSVFLNKPSGDYQTRLTFFYTGLFGGLTNVAEADLIVRIQNVGTVQTTTISLEFSTQADFTNGLNSLQNNLINNVFSNQPFKLFVKPLTPSFTYAGNNIPADNLLLQYDNDAASPLNAAGALLLPNSGTIAPAISNRSYSIKSITAALNDFFLNKPPGTYALNYQVYLTDAGNVPIAGASATATITIEVSNAVSLKFNPAALLAALNFASTADYIQGVQVHQEKAIEVFSNNPYRLSVRSSTAHLTNSVHTIPIENILLKAIPEIVEAGILTPEVTLSNAAKTIIDASSQGLGTFSKTYHLQYSTAPGNTSFLNKPAGTYSTTLTYTLTAP